MQKVLSLLGRRIRFLRQKTKLTQEKAAERLGITPKHMGELERGVATPSLDLLFRIASLYSVSVSELLVPEPNRNRRQLIHKISALVENADEATLQALFRICLVIMK